MHPVTRAEATDFLETSRHADVLAFVRALEARRDPRLRVQTFGVSPEGRELPLLVLGHPAPATPAEARARLKPVVLVINGIHAGEVEGKEASLMLVRDLLDDRYRGLLDHLTLLVVPLFNPDGNDRIDPRNRRLDLLKLEGQLGPASGVGTRVNASGVNLNRDYLRQSAPEMRLLTGNVDLVWEPDLTIDCHATNGSVHRFALTYDVPHPVASGRAEPVRWMCDWLLPRVTERVRTEHGRLTGWYGNFVADEGGEGEGWITYPHHPRFGSNYRGLTGRLDLLLECYSYIPFADRVYTTYAFVLETLRDVAAHGDEVLALLAQARTPPEKVAVRYRLEAFDGDYAVPTTTPRTLHGAPTWVHLPRLGRFVGTVVVDRPAAYLVPPEVAAHLALHGLRVEPAPAEAEVEVAVVERYGSEGARAILEAGAVGEATVRWTHGRRRVPDGWRRVPTDQPRGAVAVYLCEPESDDGLLENGVVEPPPPGAEFPAWRQRG